MRFQNSRLMSLEKKV